MAREPVVRGVTALGRKLGLRLRTPPLVDGETTLNLLEDLIVDEAGHPALDHVPDIGVLADVGPVLEELVQGLRREVVTPRRAHALGVEAIANLLHRDAVRVVVKDLRDDRSSLRVLDVTLVLIHGEAENLVPVGEGSLGVVPLASADVG